jgi:hypothetical protein
MERRMILTRTIRGIERTVCLEWDVLPYVDEATLVVTFIDGLAAIDLTDLELATLRDDVDEIAWIALRGLDMHEARP